MKSTRKMKAFVVGHVDDENDDGDGDDDDDVHDEENALTSYQTLSSDDGSLPSQSPDVTPSDITVPRTRPMEGPGWENASQSKSVA